MSAICSKATAQAVTLNPEQGTVKRRLPLIIPGRPSQQSQIRGAVVARSVVWGPRPAESWE
jgi:hypothetical protein